MEASPVTPWEQIVERWAEAKWVEAFFEDAGRRAASLEEGEASALLEGLERARKFHLPRVFIGATRTTSSVMLRVTSLAALSHRPLRAQERV